MLSLKSLLSAFGKRASANAFPGAREITISVQNGLWWQSYTPPEDGVFILIANGGGDSVYPVAEIQDTAYSGAHLPNTPGIVWCFARKGIAIRFGVKFGNSGYAKFIPARYTQ